MDVYDTTTFKLQPKISGEYILLRFMICIDLHHFDVSITHFFFTFQLMKQMHHQLLLICHLWKRYEQGRPEGYTRRFKDPTEAFAQKVESYCLLTSFITLYLLER